MFNKKQITVIAALSLSAILLAGCQENAEPINIFSPAAAGEAAPTSESAPAAADEAVSNETTASSVTESRTAEPTATINVNCTLPDSAPSQVALLKTTPFWFEDGLPEQLLLNDVNYKWYETRQNECFPEISVPIYVHTEDDLLLLGYNCNGGGDFYFNRYDTKMTETARNHLEYYGATHTKVLDGFTPEDAVSRADALLEQLGIADLLGDPKVWAIKADEANEYLSSQEWHAKDGSVEEWDKWTADDEVYCLTYPVVFNGIPVSFSGSMSGNCTHYCYGDELATDGTYVEVTVAKDKIMFVNTMDVPAANAETVGTADITVTAQQALDVLTQYYTAENFPSAVNVNDCSLVYVMTNRNYEKCEFILKPMWKFEMSYESTYESYGEIPMIGFVDASTGVGIFD